jgi:hypothetical protein
MQSLSFEDGERSATERTGPEFHRSPAGKAREKMSLRHRAAAQNAV